MIENNHTWSFPNYITFEMVSSYSKNLEEASSNRNIVFDLSKTKNIHSSFIGFLINTKQMTEKKGGNLKIYLSPELEQLFIVRNLVKILPYFHVKKSA